MKPLRGTVVAFFGGLFSPLLIIWGATVDASRALLRVSS